MANESQPFIKFICLECGHSDEPCKHFQHREWKKFEEILKALKWIIHLLERPQSATLTYVITTRAEQSANPEGDNSMASQPLNLNIGDTASPQFQEFDGPNGTGNPVPNGGPITYSVDNPAIGSVDANSGLFTALSAGTANITATDSTNGISATDQIVVASGGGGGKAQSATLIYNKNVAGTGTSPSNPPVTAQTPGTPLFQAPGAVQPAVLRSGREGVRRG